MFARRRNELAKPDWRAFAQVKTSQDTFARCEDVAADSRLTAVHEWLTVSGMRAIDEATIIDQIIERLVADHTEIPADDVARAVQGALARFQQSPIREFVPLFVERRARIALAEWTAPALDRSA